MFQQKNLLIQQQQGLIYNPSIPKSYFVTNWQTGEIREIPYRGDSLEKFIISIGISFHIGTRRRLYVLYPESTHDQRSQITTKEQLEEILNAIDEHQNDKEWLEILYIYPKDESPSCSPPDSPLNSPAPQILETKSDSTTSSKTERSTYHGDHRSEVLRLLLEKENPQSRGKFIHS